MWPMTIFWNTIRTSQSLTLSIPQKHFFSVDQSFLHEAYFNWPLSLYDLIVFPVWLVALFLASFSEYLDFYVLQWCRVQCSNLFFIATCPSWIHSPQLLYIPNICCVSKICIPFLTYFKFQNSTISSSSVVFPLDCLTGI